MLEQNGEERRTLRLDADLHGEYLTMLDRRVEKIQEQIMQTEVVKTHPYFKEQLSGFLEDFARAWCYAGHLMVTNEVTENELAVLDMFAEEDKEGAN